MSVSTFYKSCLTQLGYKLFDHRDIVYFCPLFILSIWNSVNIKQLLVIINFLQEKYSLDTILSV